MYSVNFRAPFQLATVGLAPRRGANPTKRLNIFEIIATLIFSNNMCISMGIICVLLGTI